MEFKEIKQLTWLIFKITKKRQKILESIVWYIFDEVTYPGDAVVHTKSITPWCQEHYMYPTNILALQSGKVIDLVAHGILNHCCREFVGEIIAILHLLTDNIPGSDIINQSNKIWNINHILVKFSWPSIAISTPGKIWYLEHSWKHSIVS